MNPGDYGIVKTKEGIYTFERGYFIGYNGSGKIVASYDKEGNNLFIVEKDCFELTDEAKHKGILEIKNIIKRYGIEIDEFKRLSTDIFY